MQNVFEVNVDRDKFQIEYDAAYYDELSQYDGKYVIETTVSKEILSKGEVRETYKKLQLVEHIFRGMKTERLNLRPIYHVREAQTRGHALIGMFSYAVIHEMESKIFPWLGEIRKQSKLSFKDIQEELKMIKLNILSFGKSSRHEVRITKLNEIQKKIFKVLKINEPILT